MFQYECIIWSIFFRPTVLLWLVYICLHPNAESLYSQLLSVQWRDFGPSCFPLIWLLHHHMSSVLLVPLTLALSLPISPVSEGNSRYIKASLQRPGWNNPLKQLGQSNDWFESKLCQWMTGVKSRSSVRNAEGFLSFYHSKFLQLQWKCMKYIWFEIHYRYIRHKCIRTHVCVCANACIYVCSL